MTVLLDAFALIALLADEPAAEEVETILRRGQAAIPAINFAEALDVLQRMQGISQARLDAVTGPLLQESLTLVPVEERMARRAADIRARRYHRTRAAISLADCVLLAAATSTDTVATADAQLLAVARQEDVQIVELTRSS